MYVSETKNLEWSIKGNKWSLMRWLIPVRFAQSSKTGLTIVADPELLHKNKWCRDDNKSFR